MRRCDVRWCWRRGRFEVEGTIWHACYRHHPTSPLRAPSEEQVHHDWQESHPEMQIISLSCHLDRQEDEDDEFFGFQPPKRSGR